MDIIQKIVIQEFCGKYFFDQCCTNVKSDKKYYENIEKMYRRFSKI